ncbi:SCO3933 family regulatory protein [Herbidospora sp. RD11066]
MRTIPIPVDPTRLTITCVKNPKPRLQNRETGEIKLDKTGQVVYEVTVSVEDDSGRIELMKIGISGEPAVAAGQQINPVGLVGYLWDFEGRWGISYRAAALLPVGEDTRV